MRKPVGRAAGKSAKLWRDAIMLAISRPDETGRKRLRALADKLVDQALDGDVTALKEIGDRIDGKPAQIQILNGDDEGGPVRNVYSWQPSVT